jgi:hypothetical protein
MQHEGERAKTAWNQDNVSEWSNMFTHRLVYLSKSN